MPENSPPDMTIPPIYLPGLKLRTVNKELEPSAALKVLADGALDSDHNKDVVIYLKHFDSSLFKLFPGQELSLAVTYTGGIKDEPALIDVYEVDESDADGEDDEEALMDETLGDIFDAGTEGEEEEGVEEVESVKLDLITVDYKHTASPFDGYYCFHLHVEDDWSSPDKVMKTLETIEVSVAVHGGEGEETPAGISDDEMAIFDFGNVKTRHGSMVGESFVIDLLSLEQTVSEKGKDSARVFFLDWNWSDILMRQVFSPQELQSFDNEKRIPQDILFLGAADNKQYNPLQDLKLHVNLFGFEGRHEDLVIKIYTGVDLNLSLKKSATNALEDAMKGATDQLDLVPSTISANVEGWITFEFGVENILLSFLARYAAEFPSLTSMSRADFEHILDPDSHKSDEEERLSSIIIGIITSIRLSVVIEDSSGTPLSKFLLDAIESNDMYYDSAVKLLQNSDNWVKEKLIKWSTMATFSSLTNLNCIHRFAQFKLSEKESIPLVDLSSEVQNQHTFEVTVTLPNVDIDPNTLCLLVHHSNGMLHFQDEDPSHKFKYLSAPTIGGVDGNDSVTFKWISTNPRKAAGKVDLTISLLMSAGLVLRGEEPSPDNHKKIGSSVSFAKQIGDTSEKHFASLKIRRSIALGIEEVSPLEESVANFLEGFFQLILKISGLEDFISRSELENSSDEIGTAFYRMMLQQNNSILWRTIMTSSVFQSNPIDPDYDEGQNNMKTAEVLMTIFDALLVAYSGSLRNAIKIIMDEKGLKETDENYEEEFESFRGKFSAVFQLSTENLASDLARFPTTKAKFISAGRILSEEIEEFINSSTSTESEDASYSPFSRSFNATGTSSVYSAYDVLVDSGLKMDRRDFEKAINNPIQALDKQSRHVSREIDRVTPHLFNLSSVPVVSATRSAEKMTSMAAIMEDNLMRMLNSAEDAGNDVTSVLETTQSAIEDILSPIDSLDGFRSTFSSLASQSKSLEKAISLMIRIILTIGKNCPLAPVRAFVKFIKHPLNMLKKAAKRGKDTIVRLNKNLSKQLRTILRMRSKISNLTDKLDAPKGAIEKFQEIISMLSTLAASGLLPVKLISKFIESTTLESFFDVLKSNTKSMKDLLEGCNREIQKVSRFFPSITSLLNSIREKFDVMKPVDNIFRTLKPWVDKAVALFNRVFSWWTRWLFDIILKPIEWAISLIMSPFQNLIRGMVEKINPFGGIQFIQDIGNGIDGIISQFNGIDDKIGDIVSFNSIPGFQSTADILANGLAIVLRAMYTLLSQAIEQGADSIEFLEDMLSESDAIDSLKELLLKEKSSNESITLSTVLLDMKAQSIDGPSARIDMYLKNNVSSNPFTYNDNASGFISRFINDESYHLVPCFASPADDAKTPYFERAKHFSWLTAPLAGILHHKLLIEHAKSLQFNCNNFTKISDVFVPQISADGKCTIQLFENFSSVQASPTDIDTRLPVKKVSPTLPNDVTKIAANLVDFISKKVFSSIHESFSLAQRGSCSWALLEKAVICKGATKSRLETIGTGVHLLTGLKEAVYYVKNQETNSFTMHNVSLFGSGFRTNESHFNSAQQAPIPNNDMIAHLRNCTLSMGQIDILKSAGQSLVDIDETKRSDIYEQMKKLKMFIVRDYNDEDHPIICHDETEQKNILCSTGVLLQPLMGLKVKEIWEYTIGLVPSPPPSKSIPWIQVGTSIRSPNGDWFGFGIERTAISADGKIVAVGDPREDFEDISEVGSVQVYIFLGGDWVPLGSKLWGSTREKTGFGRSVALSQDGSVLGIGAPSADSPRADTGHASVYDLINGEWELRYSTRGIRGWDYTGDTISLSSNGNTMVTSAPGYSNSPNILGTLIFSIAPGDVPKGSLVSYRDYARIGGDSKYSTLSGSGTVLAVSNYNYTSDSKTERGRIRVYSLTNDGTRWELIHTFYGMETNSKLNYVKLSQDGNIIAMSQILHVNGQIKGLAQVFQRDNSGYVKRGGDIITYVNYPWRNVIVISLSGDGDTLAIGTSTNNENGEDSSKLQVYHWSENKYSIIGDYFGSTGTGEDQIYPFFSQDGKRIALGYPASREVRVFEIPALDSQSSPSKKSSQPSNHPSAIPASSPKYSSRPKYSSLTSNTNSAMLTRSANVARNLRSDIAMRERGRGASVRSSGDFMLRTRAGSISSDPGNSSISDLLLGTGIGGAPRSNGGAPIVRIGAREETGETARKLIEAFAEKTVKGFSGVFSGENNILKRCIVVVKSNALQRNKYRYTTSADVNSTVHIVTSDPTNDIIRGKTVVKLKKVGFEIHVSGYVDVRDLDLAEDTNKNYRTKDVLRELHLFPNEGISIEQNIQGRNPVKWGLTLKQFRDYVKFCKEGKITVKEAGKRDYLTQVAQSNKWRTLKRPNNFETDKDWVNAHDLNKEYIMKHTKGTGMGIALNMQKNPRFGNTATVMLSHAWSEDMSQLLLMLEEAKNNKLELQSGQVFGDDTVLWFCCFAQFQVNRGTVKRDNLGPLLSEQMGLDPFEKVIESSGCRDMIVLQTTTCDPNSRFWCVLELFEALKKMNNPNEPPFTLHYLFSKKFLKTYVRRANVHRAKKWVRTGSLWSLSAGPREGGNPGNLAINPDGVFTGAVPRYKLMKVDDEVTLTYRHINNSHEDTHTWDLSDEQKMKLNFQEHAIWPKLKYDIFMSKKERVAGWEAKFIDVGNDTTWKEMQKTIITFQRKSALEAMIRNLDTNFKFW